MRKYDMRLNLSSLRERRRKRTENTIRRAAVGLATRQGLEKVTIEMISEAAGISARTFFNYFPFKEAAFLPPKLVFPEDLSEKFITGKNDILADIAALLWPQFQDISDDRDFAQKSYNLAVSNQKLMMLRTSAFHEFEKMIAGLIQKRLEHSGEAGDPHLMAALVMASIRRGFELWMRDETTLAGGCILNSIKDIPTAFSPKPDRV